MNNFRCLFIGGRSAGKTFILRRLQELDFGKDKTELLPSPIVYTEPTVGLEYYNLILPNTIENRIIRTGELGSDLIGINGTNAEFLPDVRHYLSKCVEWLNDVGESQRHLLVVVNKCFETFSVNHLEIKENLKLKELFEDHRKMFDSREAYARNANEFEFIRNLCVEDMKIFHEHYSTPNTSITSVLVNAHSGRNLSSIVYWLHLFAKRSFQ